MLEFLLKCQAALMTHKMQKKTDPDVVKEQKLKITQIMKDMTKLSENPDVEFLD